MLQELRDFISGYPDNFGFQFSDEVFLPGLKFSFKEYYPWKNHRQMKDFFNKLWTHETPVSYQKIMEWETVLQQECAHIYYSRALLLRFSSLIMISAGMILIALQFALPSIVFAGTGILMLLFDIWFRRMARRSRQSLILLKGLLNMLIEHYYDEHNKAA